MLKIRLETKNKSLKLAIFGIGLIFVFYPILITAQQQVDISISANVASSSTPPSLYCGDGECNNGETCNTCAADCGGCSGGIIISPKTKVVFKGQAYPFANITIMKSGSTVASFRADGDGFFEKQITGVPSETQIFSIFAEDTKGIISVTLSFTIPILEGRITTISGIFIPPTIKIEPIQVEQGQKINASGQSFPESEINLVINPKNILKNTKATSGGGWAYSLDTAGLEEGEYEIQAKAIDGNGKQSAFSQALYFTVLKSRCRGADLNFDGKVDLVDFSILLYFWNQKTPANRCADINGDGIVNIIDFSIMMYWWND
jgi:hypothetical protein